MNTSTKLILAAALATATTALADGKAKKAKPTKATMGQCFGVVGKEQGECGGKDPESGATWSCAGQNPTADLGWKRLSKGDCDKAPKHADAKAKRFVPDPA